MPPAIDAIFETAAQDAGWWVTTGVLTLLSGLVTYGGWLASQADSRAHAWAAPLRGLAAWVWWRQKRWDARYDRLEEYLAVMEAERPQRACRGKRMRFRVGRAGEGEVG